jgi:hypothetical protein
MYRRDRAAQGRATSPVPGLFELFSGFGIGRCYESTIVQPHGIFSP